MFYPWHLVEMQGNGCTCSLWRFWLLFVNILGVWEKTLELRRVVPPFVIQRVASVLLISGHVSFLFVLWTINLFVFYNCRLLPEIIGKFEVTVGRRCWNVTLSNVCHLTRPLLLSSFGFCIVPFLLLIHLICFCLDISRLIGGKLIVILCDSRKKRTLRLPNVDGKLTRSAIGYVGETLRRQTPLRFYNFLFEFILILFWFCLGLEELFCHGSRHWMDFVEPCYFLIFYR